MKFMLFVGIVLFCLGAIVFGGVAGGISTVIVTAFWAVVISSITKKIYHD